MTTDLFKNTHRREMPLTSDYVFRTAFGRDRDDSRAALIAILNIILDRKDDPIQSIEIKNPIDTAEKPGEKETVMDIRAETNQGEQLDIEMQTGLLIVYPNRVIFYGGRLVNSSLQKGEEYDKMKKSIVVSIINGTLFPSIPSCHNVFEVRECSTGLLLSDRLSFHFLELGKVGKDKPISEMTRIEKLAFYLKYASDEKMKDYVQEILAEEDFAMAENAYRTLTQDEIEFQRMESRIRDEHHRSTELAYARKEGMKEGISMGEEKLSRLYSLLIEQNRIDDLQKASADKAYRQKLYREFGLE
ncbi:MAG: Rpn family recombination-promoting nuclease/putative transposase [Firmicutes bacterium]|nr:Rpn family recombination-promoting nuclease/putative transposase [Bacillota bacterium]MDY5857294.1 Rpn family recombination-promoting nuclease/putative transposase [Anaerovoracaceae bacterium]